MLPVNPLGDAAAAEAMVTQATKNQSDERRSTDQNFDRLLFLNRELAHHAVQPLATIETNLYSATRNEYSPGFNRLFRKKIRNRNAVQPLLFDMDRDSTMVEYPKNTSLKPGRYLDVKV